MVQQNTSKTSNGMKILLVGGGSGGPVTPLLAVAEYIKGLHPKAEFLLIGTKTGPEAAMAEKAGVGFKAITAGKWRRYFSLANTTTPFLVLAGFFQSLNILKSFRPDAVFGAGSFVQVPLVWAAWFLNIPVVLHQQDLAPSLANKLCQLAAKKITVTFEPNLTSFSSNFGLFYKKRQPEKVVLTGNPFRRQLLSGNKDQAIKFFNLQSNFPTLLVLGGGTGAEFLNNLVWAGLPALCKVVQVIHSTGAGKIKPVQHPNYHAYEFINNMADAYASADFVLARAGLSTITELSNLDKVSIIVPMPNSHQEQNAWLLFSLHAAVVLDQQNITPVKFTNLIRKLLFEHEAQKTLSKNISKIMPHGGEQKIAEIIIQQIQKN